MSLSWQTVGGASGYTVYRGTSAGSVTTQVGTPSGATFTDNAVNAGTTYFYKVVANSGAGNSPDSAIVSATPRDATCTTGNAIAVENCLPGTPEWKTPTANDADSGGIEGFLTRSSIAAGDAVDIKVRTSAASAPYHIDIYRTGWYGGAQGRFVGRLNGLIGTTQSTCPRDFATGEKSCAGWSVTSTLTTTSTWRSGVYILKLIRDDNATANYMLLTIRDDSRVAPGLFVVPTDTYQAYNNYGGRSLYTFNSDGNPTVSGTSRAVKVSFDRPYQQSVSKQHDFFTIADVQLSSWLERQGYDISYADSVDINDGRASVNSRTVVMLGAHDEYQSSEMRNALTGARDNGVDVVSFGANASFWRSRYEASSVTGIASRTLVAYKTTEGGAEDPTSIKTRTWRDPLGANQPENALWGGMYVGESSASYPLFVTADQGKNRFWRYTSITNLPAGTSAQIGHEIVGWEWDRRVNNGLAPANVQALSSSPVSGSILQDSGGVYAPGPETQESTIYKAASGATVWSAGTIQWGLGLGLNMLGRGEPDSLIQQGTANVLADMGLRPTTASGVTLDATGNLQITGATPPQNPDGTISTTGTGVLTFDRPLDPDTVKPSAITLTGPGGVQVPLTIVYNATAKTISLTPVNPLDGNTTYTMKMTTAVTGWNGLGLTADLVSSFTTGAGAAPVVTGRTPAPGSTGASLENPVTATFDRGLKATTVTSTTAKLTAGATTVPATVAYDSVTRTVSITPTAPLSPLTTYTATLTTGITAVDGTPLASAVTWSFTTADVITITSRSPGTLASGISSKAVVRVQFSRSIDASTLTAANLNLKRSGNAVTAAIAYDASTRVASLTPSAPMLASTTYTVAVTSAVRGLDDAPVTASTWTFTTALTDPAIPAATATTPAGGATGVAPDTAVTLTFSQSLDPLSINGSTVYLTGPDGVVPASLAYVDASRTLTLTPAARLASNVTYTARATTGLRSNLGQPPAADIVFSFTTADCPCSTMATLAPAITGIDVRDGRPGSGPFSRELGVKMGVDSTSRLTALRFYKSPGETGTHIGKLWSSSGALLASVTFTNETAAGWQQQALSNPVTLRSDRTYVFSINANTYYVSTRDQLATALSGGPLHTIADGANGVFGAAAGSFPADSWRTSNYFVDGVIENGAAAAATPQVTATTPTDGASGIGTNPSITATFNVPLDASTVNSSNVTLRVFGGSTVSATVSYDDANKLVRITPAASLSAATTYQVQISTGLESYDDTALPAAFSWKFTTVDPSTPQVNSTSPSTGSTNISGVTDVRATFSMPMLASSITTSTVQLAGPSGNVAATVTYDGATKTAILVPSAALAASTTYTATVTTGAKSSTNVALPAAVTWTFTTSACPCRLFTDASTPDRTRPVQDGRSGAGPWSYEMGVRITVSQPAQLTAIRYYKSSGETGTHLGRLWSSTGTKLAETTFTGETATGWQQVNLPTPVSLTPGQVYVVSVGMNAIYSVTTSGLASAITNGPLSSVADGANGVYGQSAGVFPTEYWSASNYWVDAVVR